MYHIYTDGACHKNGEGGWAVLAQQPFNRSGCYKDTHGFTWSGYVNPTTNNRMELQAVIQGIQLVQEFNLTLPVQLYSDSQYVVKGLNEYMPDWKLKDWKKGKKDMKNVDLWKILDGLARVVPVELIWTRGHAEDPYNNLVDALAVAASNKIEVQLEGRLYKLHQPGILLV